jgi:hypothetical protein
MHATHLNVCACMQLMHVLGRGVIPQPAGAVLSCAAAGVVKTPLMRVQEPFAAILNRLAPAAKLVPGLKPEQISVSAEAVRFLLLPCPLICVAQYVYPTPPLPVALCGVILGVVR